MKILEGAIYTVDDVSDLLGIPRPTLYRYLREYSIPHLRQGGRIRIPEDSFDRIREARDLHKEGLGTESVRRQIREGAPDTGGLDRRLDSLHETLEDLKDDLKAKPSTGEVALSPALRTILARQSLMLSAMFNLTGMVEDLLLANGRPRKRPVQRFEEIPADAVAIETGGRGQLAGTVVENVPMRATEPAPLPSPAPRAAFGSLARRRRRGALAVLSVLLLGLFLVYFLPTLGGDETASGRPPAAEADRREPPEARPAGAADGADREGDTGAGKEDAQDGGGAGGAAVAAATDGSGDTPSNEVPDLSGRPVGEAVAALREAGYELAAVKSQAGPEEPGTVIETEPAPGTRAPQGALVVLTTSSGPAASATASAASASTASASTASASAAASASSASSPGASASPAP